MRKPLFSNTVLLKTLVLLASVSLFMLNNSSSILSQSTSAQEIKSYGKPVILVITQKITPTQTTLKTVYAAQIQQPTPQNNFPWGVSQQLDQHTYTIKVANDPTMATPQDIFTALNNYRNQHGSGTLSWDSALANYAQSRTTSFNQAGKLDEHAGFQNFLNNENGFQKLGYGKLGENSSIGYQLIGVHLIEWVYASDEPHNKNQLDPGWTAVGIGVSGTSTDLVFGGNKM